MHIGEQTRLDTIKKWNDGVKKNTELLLAFPLHELNDEPLERFRAIVAERIKLLSDYLATGTWDMFLGTELQEPPSKAERDAQAAEDAARAEAERNAQAAGEIIDVVSKSPLALPEPKCCHFDGGCNCPENPDPDKNCDGCRRECAYFQLNPGTEQPKKDDGETIGGIPAEAFDEAKKDIEARKEADAKRCKFYDRTAGKCTNPKAPCADGICDGTNTGCPKYKACGKNKKSSPNATEA